MFSKPNTILKSSSGWENSLKRVLSITEQHVCSNSIIFDFDDKCQRFNNNSITSPLTISTYNKPVYCTDVLKIHGNTHRKHFKFVEHVVQFPGLKTEYFFSRNKIWESKKHFSGGMLRVFPIYHKWLIKLETGRVSQTVLQKLTRKFLNGRNPKREKTDLFASVLIYAVFLHITEIVPRLTLPLTHRKPLFPI